MYKDYKFSNQIKVLSISLILIGLLGILYGFYVAPTTVDEAKEIVSNMSHDSDYGGSGYGESDHGGSGYGESDHGDSDHGHESSGHEYDHDKHVFNQLHNKPWAAIYVPALFLSLIHI
mgnify:CR=1 FL=1